MRRAISDIIKEMLEDGAKTSTELKEGTKQKVLEFQESFSDKTYYYHLKKLIDRGEVKKVPTMYDLTRLETDEVHLEVLECIAFIKNKEENEGIIHSKIRRLRHLSQKFRVADSEVIDTLEECLENPKITEHHETFEELVHLLLNILQLERGQETSRQIVLKITNEISKKIIRTLKRKLDFPSKNTISFLCETGKKEAVDLLFEKIKEHKNEVKREIDQIGFIFRDTGNRKQLKIIKKNIDDLIRSDDVELKEIGKRFDEYVSSRDS